MVVKEGKMKTTWEKIEQYGSTILMYVVYGFAAIGGLLYFIKYIQSFTSKEPIESPLALAAVATALGGFILLGAFYKGENEDSSSIAKRLRSLAKLFLGSSVLFVLAFLFLYLVASTKTNDINIVQWIVIVLTNTIFLIGILLLSFGLALLAKTIPDL